MTKNQQLTSSQLEAIKNVFQTFDRNGDGSISVNELDEMMSKFGRRISPDELKRKMASLDENKNGKLEFDEFIQVAAETFLSPWTEADIQHAFQIFDIDSSGKISVDELRRVARTSGIRANEQELEVMIKEADTDGDGQVDYQEFYKIMTS